MSQNYQNQTKIWTKYQSSILTKSLTIAGLMFIVIAAIGYGFGVLFTKHPVETSFLYVISLVLLFGTMFSSIYISMRIERVSKITILATMLIYSIAQGIGFGSLFWAFGIDHPENLMVIFAFAGLIALVCGLLGKLMSLKTALTLGKVLIACSIGVFFVLFISMFLMIFTPIGFPMTHSIVYMVMGVLFMGYIAYDIKMISSLSSFVGLQEQSVQSNFVLFFAYKLLMDLIGLIWVLASIFLRYAR